MSQPGAGGPDPEAGDMGPAERADAAGARPVGPEPSEAENLAGGAAESARGPAAPRPGRLRWAVLAGLAAAVILLFVWSPGGDGGGPDDRGDGERASTVSAGVVERDAFAERSTYPGELTADRADLASKIGGRVTEVAVRTGDEVERGEVVARLDARQLRAQREEASAQVEAASSAERRTRVQLEAAERDLERNERLAERDVISQQDVDDVRDRVASLREDLQGAAAERAQARARVNSLAAEISESAIEAPFSGTVSERYVDPGDFVQSGARVVRLVSGSPLRVVFEVPERDVGAFGKDAPFDVRAPPTRGETFRGRVTGAAREIVREKRIARVEGAIDEAPDSWLPGMYAEVITPKRAMDDALVIPDTALLSRLRPDGELRHGVFRPVDGEAQWVPVTVLGEQDDRVAVDADLEAGDRVLVSGHRELGDGQSISLVGEDDDDPEASSGAGQAGAPGEGPVAGEEERHGDDGADGEGGA